MKNNDNAQQENCENFEIMKNICQNPKKLSVIQTKNLKIFA